MVIASLGQYMSVREKEEGEIRFRELHEHILALPDVPNAFKERVRRLQTLRDSAGTEKERRQYQKQLDQLFIKEGGPILEKLLTDSKLPQRTQ